MVMPVKRSLPRWVRGAERTRETEGDTWRRRCFQPLAENPVQVHEGDNFQPRPSPISKDLVLSRRHCLCAQNRDRQLCLATRPKHYVWLPAEFVKKHWGQPGEAGSPDLRRQHALHGGKAASSRTGDREFCRSPAHAKPVWSIQKIHLKAWPVVKKPLCKGCP